MKRILLTAEEAAVASENGVSTESIDAFLNTLEKMELKEIVSKYGESFLWAIITTITGIILVRWALNVIMRYIEKSNLAPGATKFLRGIVAFLLYFVVILTAASVLGIPVTSVLAVFSVFTALDIIGPFFIIKIPLDCFCHTVIKLCFRQPTEFG